MERRRRESDLRRRRSLSPFRIAAGAVESQALDGVILRPGLTAGEAAPGLAGAEGSGRGHAWPAAEAARSGGWVTGAPMGRPASVTLPRPCLVTSRTRSLGPASVRSEAGFQGRASG